MPLDFDVTPTITKDYALNRLIVEEGITESVVMIFKQVVPKTVSLFKSLVPSFTELDEKADVKPVKTADFKKTLELLHKLNFTVYADVLVTVPEGFHGDINLFLKTMNRIGKDIAVTAPKILQDYTTELSMFLSNSDVRMSLKSMDVVYARVKDSRHAISHDIEVFFDPKKATLSRQKLGDVMDRFADLGDAFHASEELSSLRKDVKFKELLAGANKAAELLTLIKQRMEDGEIENVSGQTARNLANGAFEVAEYLEAVAMYGYYSEAILGSIQSMSEQLQKFVKP